MKSCIRHNGVPAEASETAQHSLAPLESLLRVLSCVVSVGPGEQSQLEVALDPHLVV